MMSHELRHPLQVIQEIWKSLQKQLDGPRNKKPLAASSSIEEHKCLLLTYFNNIGDLYQIKENSFELEMGPVAIEALCQASLRLVKQVSQKKRLKVSATFDTYSMAATIECDQRRLKQIIVTLLCHAIQSTPEGGSIGLESRADMAHHMLCLTVLNSGIGMGAEETKELFLPMAEVDEYFSGRDSDAGSCMRSCLSLVQYLVKLHGGTISVQSQKGQGSRITVSLPWQGLAPLRISPLNGMVQPWEADVTNNLARSRKMESFNSVSWQSIYDRAAIEESVSPISPISPTATDALASKNGHSSQEKPPLILLAEDNEPNISTLSEYLPVKGYRVIVARDGLEAIQLAEQTLPDLILMDVQMPCMDGLEATRHLRANPSFLHTPIIALTALAMTGDRERCLEAGANEYLSKPFSLKHLVRIIDKHLNKVNSF